MLGSFFIVVCGRCRLVEDKSDDQASVISSVLKLMLDSLSSVVCTRDRLVGGTYLSSLFIIHCHLLKWKQDGIRWAVGYVWNWGGMSLLGNPSQTHIIKCSGSYR
eukprot:6862495-Ditylum_brightwellii.AAC.1